MLSNRQWSGLHQSPAILDRSFNDRTSIACSLSVRKLSEPRAANYDLQADVLKHLEKAIRTLSKLLCEQKSPLDNLNPNWMVVYYRQMIDQSDFQLEKPFGRWRSLEQREFKLYKIKQIYLNNFSLKTTAIFKLSERVDHQEDEKSRTAIEQLTILAGLLRTVR